MAATRRKLHAVSLDYDHCFAHSRVSQLFNNPHLLHEILKNPYPKILLVGSNRQDYRVNNGNYYANKNGDCFEEMLNFEKHLQLHGYNAKLNKLTLADVDAYLPAGFCFDRALRPDAAQIKHPSFVPHWDNSKLRMLYAQMQALAAKNPDADIEFDFYDDRDEMLCDLFKIFSQYPALKPGNVKLNLHHYNGSGKPIYVGSCDYTDEPIDYNWQNNTRRLGSEKYCMNSGDDRCVNPLMIPTFLHERSLRLPPDAHYREPEFAIEKSTLKYAICRHKRQDYKYAAEIYAGIKAAILPAKDREKFFSGYAKTLLEVCKIDPPTANQYPEYKTVETFKEKIKFEYVCKIQKKLPSEAKEIYAEIDPNRLSTTDLERYKVLGYELDPVKNRKLGYLPPGTHHSTNEDGVNGQDFDEIIRNYKGSCLNCCGYFSRSGTMKALRKLQRKDWVTINEIEAAIRTDNKSNRRISIFRGKCAVDGSGTEAVLVELGRACNLRY